MPQLAVGMAGPRRFAALFALSELTNLVYLCYFFDARAKPIVVRHLQEALAALGTGVTSNAAVRGAFWASVLWDVAFFAAGVGVLCGRPRAVAVLRALAALAFPGIALLALLVDFPANALILALRCTVLTALPLTDEIPAAVQNGSPKAA